jgi:O-antigen/teichoic acid export membrane protein
VLIALFTGSILHILVPPAFRKAAPYAVWIALAYLFRAVGGYFAEIFVIEKRPDLNARVTWVGTIVCLAGYAILIPRYGVWGAVIATVCAFLVVLVYSFWVAQRVRHVDYEYLRFGKLAACAAAVVGVFFAFRPASLWGELALGVGMTLLFGGLLYVTRFLQDEESRYVAGKVRALTAALRYQST